MHAELMLMALEQALTLCQPTPDLVIYADRSSQYTSSSCRTRLEKAHVLAKYSRPGNPHNNAPVEAGWSTLKTELFSCGGALASLQEDRIKVDYYFDTYINLGRRHSILAYSLPYQFERDFQISLS
jgi:putative transposase